MTCPSCQSTVPEGARFCPTCGYALQVQGDERRVVTVLFGDLVGFTGLAESRDPEHVKNIVDRCFEGLAADITSYGGRIDKIVGDGIIALFGAPTAHEDDAERAVRAALQMQRTLAERIADLGDDVRMRIGVNTGEVVVGALRSGGDYTAMGDVVNIASRLQTAAQPGQVIVGPDTHAATAGVFRYEPLGALQVQGRDEAVEAWVAIEAVTAPGRRPRRSETPLVGRDAEVEMLCAAFGATIGYRRPHLAVIVGEAGMGKSRLAEHVVIHAHRTHGAIVLVGRSLPYGEGNPWWPLAEALRQATGIDPVDGAGDARSKCVAAVAWSLGSSIESADTVRTAEALLYLMGFEGRLNDVEPSRARDEALRGVREFLEGMASQRPLVLVLSDVQWADQGVLEMVDHLLGRLHRLPLVVLLTARPELEERWRPTPGRHNLIVLNLDPLDERSAGELLNALLGHVPDDDLRRLLLERSGGNPFFLEELVALLTESGALAEAPDGAVPFLPATLRGLVAARLDALPAAERGVLEDAAVLGRRGPLDALAALAESRGATADVHAAVDSLVGKELLITDGRQCEFRSDLVREVAYGTMTKAERARRHANLACWLEEQASDKERPDELLQELSRQYAAAAELAAELGQIDGVPADIRDRALLALERAAERAEDREIHVVSERLFDQQLRLLGPEDGSRRRHALIGRARAATALHRLAPARADLETVLAEAADRGDEVATARALTVLGDLERGEGAFDRSLATLDDAVAVWRRLGDRRGEAAALRRQGMTYLFVGDTDAAEAVLLDAYDAFKDIGARKGIGWVNHSLAWIAFMRGQSDLAEERLLTCIDLFGDIGDWGGLGWARGLLGWVKFTKGDMVEAERLANETIDSAYDQGDKWAEGMMTVLLASIHLWQGRPRDAVERAERARAVFADIGDTWGSLRALAPLSRALAMIGRVDDARAAIDEAYRVVEPFPAGDESRFPFVMEAQLDVHVGEGPGLLDRGLVDSSTLHPGLGITEMQVAHGLALAQDGRADEAVPLLEETLRGCEAIGPRANVESALALTLAAAGRGDDARKAAAAVLEREGGTYLDRTTALLAEALAAARDRGGRDGDALAVIDRASASIGATDDELTAAIVLLARARVLEAVGDATAATVLDDAHAAFRGLGVTGAGWDTLFRHAAGVTSEV